MNIRWIIQQFPIVFISLRKKNKKLMRYFLRRQSDFDFLRYNRPRPAVCSAEYDKNNRCFSLRRDKSLNCELFFFFYFLRPGNKQFSLKRPPDKPYFILLLSFFYFLFYHQKLALTKTLNFICNNYYRSFSTQRTTRLNILSSLKYIP